jgi:hypothetical protein
MRKSGRSVRFSLRAEYLTYLGVKDIVFEPDGNVSPDFVVNGKIAIEVRRLNQHYSDKSGKPEGLEQLAMPLRQRLETLLRMLGPPTNNLSWWVSYRFKRPQLTRNWEVAVREKLQAFQSATLKADEGVIEIDRNFRLRLMRASKPGKLAFILAGNTDSNAGGWVIPELEKNLTLCIAEKTRKIAPYRSKYPEWWLIFVDFVMGGMQEPVQIKHNWDKVIMMHPSNYAGAYEIKSPV